MDGAGDNRDDAALTVEQITRVRLPNKRPHFVAKIEWLGAGGGSSQEWLVGVGFDEAGAAREIFLTSLKTGTDMQILADDWCIVLSRALQFGDRVQDILTTLNGVGSELGTHPPSLLHKALAAVAQIEREHGGMDRPLAAPRADVERVRQSGEIAMVSQGAKMIDDERHRQIAGERYDAEHDDQHTPGDLALAGAAYAMHGSGKPGAKALAQSVYPKSWDESFWKPKTPLRDLVRAGALIAAEIDRRLAAGETE